MHRYIGQMMMVYFVVDILLLVGTNLLSGHIVHVGRALLAALYGSIFAGCCLLPRFSFMNGTLWQLAGFFATGLICFGGTLTGIRSGLLYGLLHMALNSVLGGRGEGSLLLCACCVFLLCVILLRKQNESLYVPVELSHNGRKMTLIALRDTGNDLRDPVTGKPVLIVDALTAEGLTGLSRVQLESPVETMGTLPGLRLIPYKTVGGSGLLLGLWLQDVKIGSSQGSSLVAFSPEIFSAEGMYQALTGGNV